MDFHFLFDDEREMFVIGYNVSDGRRDNSFYDLLASESRLTSLIAIAKGDAPQANWFRLGRQLTQLDGVGRALCLVDGDDVRVPNAAHRHTQLRRDVA